ncbi:hypothetical protein K0M31_010905 [Melipona bicolor]|uniref:Uncharacterized protein n=1 Tax=Melipona bicolor TaxID=60889 RepID=A0AA40FKA1_9HYME|nr:hypothetical protein K0M31_010905 [Melipona bicolor]
MQSAVLQELCVSIGLRKISSSLRLARTNSWTICFSKTRFGWATANFQQLGKRVLRILDDCVRPKSHRSTSVLAKHLDNVLQQMQALRRARWFLCPGYAAPKMFKYLEILLGKSNFEVIDFDRFFVLF